MYSTYILVHPRTQQLQNALTLEDYQQIQALLEYVLQRQQQGFLQHVGDREHVRLVQALYNNKLMQLDYRRQRAAQLQRLLQHYHNQFHDCDRARLLAALEKQRAQQAFRRFIEAYYQQQSDDAQDNCEIDAYNKPAISSQASVSTIPTAAQTETQQTPEEEEDQEEPIDDAYEQYQTQQLEGLLKHIFEKNTEAQQSGRNDSKDDDNDEYMYAPVREDPQDEQTVADLLPLLSAENDTTTRPVDSPPEKAPSPPSQAPATKNDEASFLPDNVLPLQDVLDELIRTPTPAMKSSDDQTPSRAHAPKPPAPAMKSFENLTPARAPAPNPPAPALKSSVNSTPARAPAPTPPTPAMKSSEDPTPSRAPAPKPPASVQPSKTQTAYPSPPVPPPKLDTFEPDTSESNAHPDRQKKLDQLAAVEQELDRLAAENKDNSITRLPLQYQVNDQGRLFLDGNTPNNRRFLTFEDAIIRCMIQLDQVLSDGDSLIRDRRRQAVRKAEALLEPVDRHKQDEWTKAQQQGSKKKKHRRHKRRVRIPVTA
jgi:hypothetical protein